MGPRPITSGSKQDFVVHRREVQVPRRGDRVASPAIVGAQHLVRVSLQRTVVDQLGTVVRRANDNDDNNMFVRESFWQHRSPRG